MPAATPPPAPTEHHLPELDILRGVAAFAVFVHHGYQQFYLDTGQAFVVDRLLQHAGAWGVGIFFVLSGFCIQWGRLQEARRGVAFDARRFLWKRFFRIYPAFVVALLVCYGIEFFDTSNLLQPASPIALLAHLTLTSSFFVSSRVAVNNVLWSVVVECHFYIVYALLWRGFSGLRGVLRMTLLAMVVSAAVYAVSVRCFEAGPMRVLVQTLFLASWWTWCLGALLAELLQRLPAADAVRWRARAGVLLCLAGSWLIALLPPPWELQSRRFVLPVLVALFLFSLLRSRFDFRRAGPWMALGAVSYSLYLFHPLAILAGLHVDAHPVLRVLLITALALGLAALSHRLIETRGMAWGRRFLMTSGRARPAGPDASPRPPRYRPRA